MYYSTTCPYCSKVFYVFGDNKTTAASTLYTGIKKHLVDYDEDRKEYKLDDGASSDTNEIYNELSESKDPPSGGYPL